MKKDTLNILVVSAALILAIIASSYYSGMKEKSSENTGTAESGVTKSTDESEEAEPSVKLAETDSVKHLRDVASLYEDNGDSYVTMYLTVREGNASEGTNHTWAEVNANSAYYYSEKGIDRYKVEGLLQVGDDSGPLPGLLGYGKTAPNATIQIRGQTSTRNSQKNYKIELKQNQGSWKGQTTFALNKHMTDGLRFRNKLGFDLLSGIDELMSLRTNFVHLYVNDLTDGDDDGFEDYGLYTQVEQLNKTALRTHGLDKNGHLYKINFFEFYRYEDAIKLESDPDFDKAKFEEYLEIKGNNDHSKLINMLNDLNDYTIPIDDVLDKHFDIENLTYWLAFNLLTGNADSQSRNVYLYSAQNDTTWYLYPWDLDNIYKWDENELSGHHDFESWERGVSNYWGNVLFQRCLKSSSFRKELDKAIKDIKTYLSQDRIRGLISSYMKITEPMTFSEPDIYFAQVTHEQYDEIASKLPALVDKYYGFYEDSLKKPLPFYIATPEIENGKLKAIWDAAYDFNEEELTYTAVLSRNPDGTDVLGEYTGKWNQTEFNLPEPGQYFLKVSVTNESGNTQDAFDTYEVEEYGAYFGVICFYVNADNTIDRAVAEE